MKLNIEVEVENRPELGDRESEYDYLIRVAEWEYDTVMAVLKEAEQELARIGSPGDLLRHIVPLAFDSDC